MGLAMAPAAYDTITQHLKDMHRELKDYDMIVTGDLSKIGFSFLVDLMNQEGYDIDNRLHDCGLMIYDLSIRISFAVVVDVPAVCVCPWQSC